MGFIENTERRQSRIDLEPLERAKDRFLADLPDEQKHLFQTASLENVYYTASNAFSDHCSKTYFGKSLAKMEPLMSALDQYGKALDVYSNTSSLFMCPIWGSVRVVFAIASSAKSFIDGLLNCFEKIGRALPLLRDYEGLFGNDLLITNLLGDSYVEILRFCSKAKHSLAKGRPTSCEFIILLVNSNARPF